MGSPGLQAHITYLAGMTANVDQKIGRDAIERYEVLRKELDTIKTEVEQLLGPRDELIRSRSIWQEHVACLIVHLANGRCPYAGADQINTLNAQLLIF